MPSCDLPPLGGAARREFPDADEQAIEAGERVAVFGGGCFWCTEAVYRQIDGVLEVEAGYAGGLEETADYRKVCAGDTGHAEVIRIRYDAERVGFTTLLKVFFSVAHDPTQYHRQGNDIGPQYRSAIFPADAEQERVARAYIAQLDAAGVYDKPIVTSIESAPFYKAEAYHQDYAAQNPDQPYIAAVAAPKVAKLRERHAGLLKDGGQGSA